jgi:hypothetical protein
MLFDGIGVWDSVATSNQLAALWWALVLLAILLVSIVLALWVTIVSRRCWWWAGLLVGHAEWAASIIASVANSVVASLFALSLGSGAALLLVLRWRCLVLLGLFRPMLLWRWHLHHGSRLWWDMDGGWWRWVLECWSLGGEVRGVDCWWAGLLPSHFHHGEATFEVADFGFCQGGPFGIFYNTLGEGVIVVIVGSNGVVGCAPALLADSSAGTFGQHFCIVVP